MNTTTTIIPYWGIIDSNIDWCEPNYAYTPYIAEFANTISSIPLALFGAAGLIFSYRYALKEIRFLLSFTGLLIVGLGSISFHLTLRRYAQSLDELPMLWAALVLLYNTINVQYGYPLKINTNTAINNNNSKSTNLIIPTSTINNGSINERRSPRKHASSTALDAAISTNNNPMDNNNNIPVVGYIYGLKFFLTLAGIIMTIIYFYIPQFFILFFIGYGSTVVAFTAIMYYNIIGNGSKQLALIAPNQLLLTRHLYKWAIIGYFSGFIVWIIDNLYCNHLIQYLYLHAIWHLLAGLGTYNVIYSQIAWRAAIHSAKFKLQQTTYLPIVQYVVINMPKSN